MSSKLKSHPRVSVCVAAVARLSKQPSPLVVFQLHTKEDSVGNEMQTALVAQKKKIKPVNGGNGTKCQFPMKHRSMLAAS